MTTDLHLPACALQVLRKKQDISMDIERLRKCNDILAKLSELKSTRDAIANGLKLSINNRYLDDPQALEAAKKVLMEIYGKRIAEKEQEFSEA